MPLTQAGRKQFLAQGLRGRRGQRCRPGHVWKVQNLHQERKSQDQPHPPGCQKQGELGVGGAG